MSNHRATQLLLLRYSHHMPFILVHHQVRPPLVTGRIVGDFLVKYVIVATWRTTCVIDIGEIVAIQPIVGDLVLSLHEKVVLYNFAVNVFEDPFKASLILIDTAPNRVKPRKMAF